MALPEKLYALRKKSGLSQEQLAEALNVSRQAISKWEGGSATPESDKLLALIVYGVLSILVPSVPAQISGSSMIRIDGSGIFLLLCVAAIAAGAALLLKSTKHK